MKYYIACIAMCKVVKPNETDSVLYFPVVVSYYVEQYSWRFGDGHGHEMRDGLKIGDRL